MPPQAPREQPPLPPPAPVEATPTNHQFSRWLVMGIAAGSLAAGVLLPGDGSSTVSIESSGIPASASNVFEHDADVMGNQDCSGFTVRDPRTRMAVGALTAAHCGFANPSLIPSLIQSQVESAWLPSTNGKIYVIETTTAQTMDSGSTTAHLHEVGQATEALAATNGDSDEAVEVFAGHSLSEVLRDLQGEVASDAEVDAMIPGETSIFVAGWPQKQKGDGYGHEELQQFAATYVGKGVAKSVAGKDIDVIYAAFPENKDGATCGYGMSGSGAFLLNGKEPTLIGNTSVGYSGHLDPSDSQAPKIVTDNPGIDWSRFASVCGFVRPNLGKQQDTLLHIVSNASEVPGLIVDSAAAANELTGNFDDHYTTTILDGTVIASSESIIGGKSVETKTAYNNPIAYFNADGSVTLAYYSARTFVLEIQHLRNLADLRVYPNANGSPSLVHGMPPSANHFVPAGDNVLGGYTNRRGYSFAERYVHVPVTHGSAERITRDQDQLVFASGS